MKLFQDIKNSVYNPDFYRELLSRPLSYSLKYFFLLGVLLTLINTIIVSFDLIPSAGAFFSSVGPKVLQYYPDDLTITIKNGHASANVQEPYFLAMPVELKSNEPAVASSTPPENFLVIDTKNPFSVDQFRADKTILLLTYDSFVYEKNGGITIQPLDRIGDWTIDKGGIKSFLDKINPYLRYLPWIFTLIFFIGYYIGFMFHLVYFLLFALVVWVIARIGKSKLTYGKSYRVAIHAATLSLILSYLVLPVIPRLSIPFLFTIIALIVTFINFKPVREGDNASVSTS